MKRSKKRLLLGGVLTLLLWPACTVGQETAWQRYMDAGRQAYEQADYAEAEKLLLAALKEAEKLDEQDALATSLNNLGALYNTQGKYAEAEPLLKRSLATWEKAVGPEHPDVAMGLQNYAELLRKTNREAEAKKMESRAEAIRAKHPQEK